MWYETIISMCGGDGTHLTTCRVSWNSRDTHDTYAVSVTLCASAYLSSVHFSPIPGDTESNQLKAFIKVMDMVCVHGSGWGWQAALNADSHVDGCFIAHFIVARPGGFEGRNQVICQISSSKQNSTRETWTNGSFVAVPKRRSTKTSEISPKNFPFDGVRCSV